MTSHLIAKPPDIAQQQKQKSNEDHDIQREQYPTECAVSLFETEVYKPQSRQNNEGDLDCFGDAGIAETHA